MRLKGETGIMKKKVSLQWIQASSLLSFFFFYLLFNSKAHLLRLNIKQHFCIYYMYMNESWQAMFPFQGLSVSELSSGSFNELRINLTPAFQTRV